MKIIYLVLLVVALFNCAICFSADDKYNKWIDAKDQNININGVDIQKKVNGQILKIFMVKTPESQAKKISYVKILFKNKEGKQVQQQISIPYQSGSSGYVMSTKMDPVAAEILAVMMARKMKEQMDKMIPVKHHLRPAS